MSAILPTFIALTNKTLHLFPQFEYMHVSYSYLVIHQTKNNDKLPAGLRHFPNVLLLDCSTSTPYHCRTVRYTRYVLYGSSLGSQDPSLHTVLWHTSPPPLPAIFLFCLEKFSFLANPLNLPETFG